MKKTIIGLIFLTLCNVAYAEGKTKKSNIKKPKEAILVVRDAAKTSEQLKWLDKINANLEICKVWFDMDEMLMSGKLELKQSLNEYNHTPQSYTVMYEEVRTEILKTSQYANCKTNTKPNVLAEAKDFIQGLVEPDLQSKAREMIAQWLTSMDAIEQKNFVEEQSKFKFLYNNLKLNLQIG